MNVREYDNVAGNHYDKYGTSNPIARRLMAGFLGALDGLVARTRAASVYEIGCGEGHLSLHLSEQGLDVRGFDLEAGVVEQANAGARGAGLGDRFHVGSVYDLQPGTVAADLILCCEVLEHLPDPVRALEIIAAQRGRHFIFSVPREPIWRGLNLARGKYVGQLGNTPGHIQHWSRRRFLALIATHFRIVEHRSPLPWTMVLCTPRDR